LPEGLFPVQAFFNVWADQRFVNVVEDLVNRIAHETTLVSVLSYGLFVRSTFISVLLNGRRYERRFGVEPGVV
jgi:hypothetical protein